jgi:carboxypeptidase Taq
MHDVWQTYRQLVVALQEIGLVDSIGSLLSWDEQTPMPPQGASLRAEQAAWIARLSHERFTLPRIDEMLRIVADSDLVRDPLGDPAVNVRETRRAFDRAKKLPTALVEEMTRTAVRAQQAWVAARKDSSFTTFLPWLEKTLDLKRQEAHCVGYSGHPYNALLDLYEHGETTEALRRVFDSLRDPLLSWLRQNIHTHGKRYTARQLVKKVTASDLSAEPLLRHLNRKAAELYGV